MAIRQTQRSALGLQLDANTLAKLRFQKLPLPGGGCPPGYTFRAKSCYETTELLRRAYEFRSNRASGFFPTLLEILPAATRVVFPLVSIPGIHLGAPEFAYQKATAAVGIPKPVAEVALKVGTALVTGNVLSGGGLNVGLNIGAILGSVGGLLGQVSSVPVLQSVGQITSAFAPAFATGPQTIAGPVYSPPPMVPRSMGTPVMGTMPVIAAAAGAIARVTAPILFRVSSKIGRRISLTGAIAMIRKMGKFLMDPSSIAIALGITVAELATLITAHSSRKTRHMNAANPKALRRAARRIKSFHRMCGTIDLLKSRGRRTSVRTICGTCRKSPCRC